LDAAKSEETFRAYLEKYVFSVGNHPEYLRKVGLATVA
jgi:hypothetical protein